MREPVSKGAPAPTPGGLTSRTRRTDGGRREREAAQQPPVAGSSRRVRHAPALPARVGAVRPRTSPRPSGPAARRRGPKLRKLSHSWQILTGRRGTRGCGGFREFKAKKPRERRAEAKGPRAAVAAKRGARAGLRGEVLAPPGTALQQRTSAAAQPRLPHRTEPAPLTRRLRVCPPARRGVRQPSPPSRPPTHSAAGC